MNDVFVYFIENDFSSDNEDADPTFNIKNFYEQAAKELNIVDTPNLSHQHLNRSLPSNYSSCM